VSSREQSTGSYFIDSRCVQSILLSNEESCKGHLQRDASSLYTTFGMVSYVMSIGVRPNDDITEKNNFGSSIIRGLRRLLIDLGRKGVIIESIVGRSDTPDGIRLMRHIGFTEIEPLLPGKRAFIIRVEELGIPLIMQYKEALRESKATEE
jgi:hypothetical protein